MIDRRDFLHGVLALGGGLAFGAGGVAGDDGCLGGLAEGPAPRQYLADLAACDSNVLGVPRCRSLVVEGLHPIAPERVVLVDDAGLRRFRLGHRGIKRRFREEEARWRARCPSEPLPQRKLDVCVGLMDRLASHYRRPDLHGRWARTLWRRELLGSTGIGHGLGLLHDFQPCDATIRTTNGVVDWWLVLLPGGVDWQALDDRPVHFMVGPVMEERRPGNYLRVMEGITRGLRPLVASDGFDPSAWADRLGGMAPADAAREVNSAVARGLRKGGLARGEGRKA